MLADFDPDNAVQVDRLAKQVEVFRRIGVKEVTDSAGRKLTIDLQHKGPGAASGVPTIAQGKR